MRTNLFPTRMRARSALLSVLVSATLSACAVGPTFERPSVPENSKNAIAAPSIPDQQFKVGQSVPANWWTLFNSDALNQLVQQARENNQELAAAQAAVQQAQELVTARTGARYPELDLTAGIGRQKYGSQFLGPFP